MCKKTGREKYKISLDKNYALKTKIWRALFFKKKYTNKKREAKVDKSKKLFASPNLSFVLPLPTIACNVAAESGEKETE